MQLALAPKNWYLYYAPNPLTTMQDLDLSVHKAPGRCASLYIRVLDI